MRRVLHALLAYLGVIPWLAAYVCMQAVFWLALLGDKVLPGANVGNCWTFVCPKLMRRGGCMVVHPVKRGRFFGLGIVPHTVWVDSLPAGTKFLQTEPLNRYEGRWQFWRFFYFGFRLKDSEIGRPSKWADL